MSLAERTDRSDCPLIAQNRLGDVCQDHSDLALACFFAFDGRDIQVLQDGLSGSARRVSRL